VDDGRSVCWPAVVCYSTTMLIDSGTHNMLTVSGCQHQIAVQTRSPLDFTAWSNENSKKLDVKDWITHGWWA
jgi:hypothetical protein